MSVASRIDALRRELDAVARSAGRDPEGVRLIAVSKGHPAHLIREAYAAGQRDFGESYPQELRDKALALADLGDLRWHFIGRLQTNKARYVAPLAIRVHALDTVDQAIALARRATGRVACLVAVNLGGEDTKGGVPPEGALDLCRSVAAHVDVVGLMTLPPADVDASRTRGFFAQLRELASAGRAEGLPLTELSMGMSQDWPDAVREGATWIRVGTALFGERA